MLFSFFSNMTHLWKWKLAVVASHSCVQWEFYIDNIYERVVLCTCVTILSNYISGKFCFAKEYFFEDYNTYFGLCGKNQTV